VSEIKEQLRASLKLIDGGLDDTKQWEGDIEGLEVDVTLEEAPVNLEHARARTAPITEIKPVTALELALEEARGDPSINKCYITLIVDDQHKTRVINYRANLTRQEEAAMRQLGLAEAIDLWRFGALPT